VAIHNNQQGSLELSLDLHERRLLVVDLDGVLINGGQQGRQQLQPLTGYTQILSRGWRRDQINAIMKEMGLRAHSSAYQTAFKVSYDVPDAALYAQVLHRLEAAGIDAKVVFSGGKNLASFLGWRAKDPPSNICNNVSRFPPNTLLWLVTAATTRRCSSPLTEILLW
jgi:hypothetical protein